MAFRFDDMDSELSEIMLIQVENIDMLKSRSQLFRNILIDYDVNSSINVDWHVNNYFNELPTFTGNKWSDKATIFECNRMFVKELGRNNFKSVRDFRSGYPLSFLIVVFNYYGCKDLASDLDELIATTPGRHLSQIMDHLLVVCEYSKSVRQFVEKTNI
jgi:hypothetical protein